MGIPSLIHVIRACTRTSSSKDRRVVTNFVLWTLWVWNCKPMKITDYFGKSMQRPFQNIILLLPSHKWFLKYGSMYFQTRILLSTRPFFRREHKTFYCTKGLAKPANIASQTLLFVSVSLAMDNQRTLLLGREQ